MAETSIEWTDVTWNPVSGCTRASAGCDNCYAVTMTNRLEAMGQEKYSGLTSVNQRGDRHFNGVVRVHEDALPIPLGWKKPRKVFVNSMSDLFHKDVPFEFIDRVFAVMALCPQHTFQVLTKRPERMAEYMNRLCTPDAVLFLANTLYDKHVEPLEQAMYLHVGEFGGWPLPNVWMGTSVENQQTADERIPHLLRVPAKVRFLSCEPLLGAVDLTDSLMDFRDFDDDDWTEQDYTRAAGIQWVICGGESGPKARPMHPDWSRSLRDQCEAAGVPFFFKQWGEWMPHSGSGYEGAHFSVQTTKLDEDKLASKVGKKAAGRLLDGRTWEQFPEVVR